jgi:transcriptional regulator with XRE-family HTH domain
VSAVNDDITVPPTLPPSLGSLPGSLGVRLRARREEQGISLRALAKAIGVSPSLISQVEHGKASPSVATLYAIVTELGLSLDELFFDGHVRFPGALNGVDAPTQQGPVLRRADRPSLALATGVRWERLTPQADPHVDFLFVTYDVGGASCPEDALMTHSGREYGLVLEGRLGATVGFDSYELDPGDSIAFSSTTPHRFWTIGDRPSVVTWTIVGRRGDPRVQSAPPRR